MYPVGHCQVSMNIRASCAQLLHKRHMCTTYTDDTTRGVIIRYLHVFSFFNLSGMSKSGNFIPRLMERFQNLREGEYEDVVFSVKKTQWKIPYFNNYRLALVDNKELIRKGGDTSPIPKKYCCQNHKALTSHGKVLALFQDIPITNFPVFKFYEYLAFLLFPRILYAVMLFENRILLISDCT